MKYPVIYVVLAAVLAIGMVAVLRAPAGERGVTVHPMPRSERESAACPVMPPEPKCPTVLPWRHVPLRKGEAYDLWDSPSRCLKVPGFDVYDGIVTRSPLVMADFLIDLVQKTKFNGTRPGRFVEIGSRNGDIFSCVSRFAAPGSVIVEASKKEHCPALEGRGLPLICSDYELLDTPEKFPEAEVYYFWHWTSEAEHMIRHVMKVEHMRQRKGRGAILVGNFDRQYAEDWPAVQGIREKYDGVMHKIFFDEGDGERDFGVHMPLVFDLEELVKKVEEGFLEAVKDDWVVPPKKNPELFDENGRMID